MEDPWAVLFVSWFATKMSKKKIIDNFRVSRDLVMQICPTCKNMASKLNQEEDAHQPEKP